MIFQREKIRTPNEQKVFKKATISKILSKLFMYIHKYKTKAKKGPGTGFLHLQMKNNDQR